jgi:hypothetical protein
MLGVPPKAIAKIWAFVLGVPFILFLGYLLVNYDSGTTDPSILNGVQLTPKDEYHSHVKNNTSITLKSLTVTCYSGGDAQPETRVSSLYRKRPGCDVLTEGLTSPFAAGSERGWGGGIDLIGVDLFCPRALDRMVEPRQQLC